MSERSRGEGLSDDTEHSGRSLKRVRTDGIQDLESGTEDMKVLNAIEDVLPQEEYEEWCKPWRMSLIVRLLGKRMGLNFMRQQLEKQWMSKGNLQIVDIS
ncbi:hypothetical protein G2W53_004584 [Senna tora]|uniref:Uncharacterized protein n=1 Tax=Senna tora TaxID=362788 RepID=A0A834XDW5_9FABA|nr:hypothetical protein G2W53_004584 [Senna tora]